MRKDLPSPEKNTLIEVMLLGSGVSHLKKGGSGFREVEYYRELSNYFDVWIFGYSEPDSSVQELPVIFKQNKWIRSCLAPLFLNNYIHKKTIIRTKQLWGCWAGWVFKIFFQKPLIIRCGYIWSRSLFHQHPDLNAILRWLITQFEKVLIRMGDAYIFSTNEVKAHYQKQISSKQSAVISNGFNVNLFKPDATMLKQYDYVYLGRLIPLKGIERLTKSLLPHQKLLVLGTGPSSKLFENKENIFNIPSVPNNELPSYLNSAHCFVSFSTTEGNPKGTFEAIMCGLYPVLSNIPVHKAIIEELGYGTILDDEQATLPLTDNLIIDSEKLSRFRTLYDSRSILKKEIDFCNYILNY